MCVPGLDTCAILVDVCATYVALRCSLKKNLTYKASQVSNVVIVETIGLACPNALSRIWKVFFHFFREKSL